VGSRASPGRGRFPRELLGGGDKKGTESQKDCGTANYSGNESKIIPEGEVNGEKEGKVFQENQGSIATTGALGDGFYGKGPTILGPG